MLSSFSLLSPSSLLLTMNFLITVTSIQGSYARDISSFEHFVEEFSEYAYCRSTELVKLNANLKVSKERECLERRTRFNLELREVRAHNALNLTWKKEINKFSVLSSDEKKHFFGRIRNYISRDGSAENSRPKVAVNNLPSFVDWRTNNYVTPIKNQGSCGSCWAFAAAEAIESFAAIQSGTLYELSTEQIIACAPNPRQCGGIGGCGGSTQELAFAYVANTTGLSLRSNYPDTSSLGTTLACLPPKEAPAVQIKGSVKLPRNDYLALMNAVANIGPVTVSLDAEALLSYSSGILKCNNNWIIDHAVQLVGYGVDQATATKYWILRNSWGDSFGENGYFRLARSDNDSSNCGIDNYPQYGTACKGEDSPITVCGSCGVLSDSSYPIGVSIAPTVAPTKIAPTIKSKAPSRKPSNEPKVKSTLSPTCISGPLLPTKTPIRRPTLTPKIAPSSYPSIQPTKAQSLVPTARPTVLEVRSPRPSSSRTCRPSKMPGKVPIFPPTAAPSINPSLTAPSIAPSSTPKSSPSVKLTLSPSTKPTKFPRQAPTKIPSSNPSATVTNNPYVNPTPLATINVALITVSSSSPVPLSSPSPAPSSSFPSET